MGPAPGPTGLRSPLDRTANPTHVDWQHHQPLSRGALEPVLSYETRQAGPPLRGLPPELGGGRLHPRATLAHGEPRAGGRGRALHRHRRVRGLAGPGHRPFGRGVQPVPLDGGRAGGAAQRRSPHGSDPPPRLHRGPHPGERLLRAGHRVRDRAAAQRGVHAARGRAGAAVPARAPAAPRRAGRRRSARRTRTARTTSAWATWTATANTSWSSSGTRPTPRTTPRPGTPATVYLDAYELDGTRLWRIDLGRNIRAGAHYTQFQVYDLDGDGRAEVACKTADGTVDGVGTVIGDAAADWRNANGYVLAGPEFLTVFDGPDGRRAGDHGYVVPRGTVATGATRTGTGSTGSWPASRTWMDSGRAWSWPAATTPAPCSRPGTGGTAALTNLWTFDTGHTGTPEPVRRLPGPGQPQPHHRRRGRRRARRDHLRRHGRGPRRDRPLHHRAGATATRST